MRKYINELIGTFALVFVGTGAIIVNDLTLGQIGHLGIGLTFGLIVATMIYSIGDISGAHINPAVTFGFWLSKRLPTKDLFPYIINQIFGAILASFLLRLLFPLHKNLGTTIPVISGIKAFGLELIITFLLMFVIIHVSTGSKEKGIVAGISVGAMVGIAALFAGPFTGASMNPARSIGPALISGKIEHIWIYLTAPFIGASLAIVTCILTREKCCINKIRRV